MNPISIRHITSVSALGFDKKQILEHYRNAQPLFIKKSYNNKSYWVSELSDEILNKVNELKSKHSKYKDLDPTVLNAILVSENCYNQVNWTKDIKVGVNFSSSRGATQTLEKQHQNYIEGIPITTATSPLTTLGSISSWVVNHLGTLGPDLSHSITCSSGLHALLNGIAWLQAGMSDAFIVGASEASISGFTLAQMEQLKIYSKETNSLACLAFDLEKTNNSMVLGDGAVVVALDKAVKPNDIVVKHIGYATEPIKHHASISAEGTCFVKSMQMALHDCKPTDIDVIITHSPGTIQGDLSEHRAIQTVFGTHQPIVTNNKWLVGHTFASSGLMSLQMAYMMLKNQEVFAVPYLNIKAHQKPLNKILINAVGFGGNAVSVVLQKI